LEAGSSYNIITVSSTHQNMHTQYYTIELSWRHDDVRTYII